MNVFISYRHDDSGATARLLRHVLSERFDASSVFMDLDQIPYGTDFEAVIREHLARADVVLVLVGPQWARLLAERVKGPDTDWVRREVAIALESAAQGKLRVVPVFIDGAALHAAELPADIAPLAKINGPRFENRASDEGEARVVAAVLGESDAQRIDRLAGERRARRWAVAAGLVVFLAAWTQLLDAFGVDSKINLGTLWLAHRAGAPQLPPADGRIALVALDDAAEAAQPSRLRRRGELAAVVTQAAAAGARALALDFEFDEVGEADTDAALEAALAAAQPRLPVLLGVRSGIGERSGNGPQPALLPRFAAHAGWGLACVGERGGVIATLPLLALRSGPVTSGTGVPQEQALPSLGLAAFVAAKGLGVGELSRGSMRLGLERGGTRVQEVVAFAAETLRRDPDGCNALRQGDLLVQQWLDVRAPPLDAIGTRVRLADVARGEPAALAALKDRIVVVGDFRTRVAEDRHQTSSGAAQGSTLIAAQIEGLLRGSAIRPLTALEQGLLLVGATLGGAVLAITLSGPRARWLWPAVGAFALLAVIGAAGAYRIGRVLAGPHYAVIGCLLGALLARRLRRHCR